MVPSDFYTTMSTLETITMVVVILGAVVWYGGKWVIRRVRK
jgi:hypothetical protein